MLVTLGIKGVKEITLQGFQTLQDITSFSYIQKILLKSTPVDTLERLERLRFTFTANGKRRTQVEVFSE